MSISELITCLNDRLIKHGDRDVEVTWEGIQRELDSSCIYLTKTGELYIDADNNNYKMGYAVDPTEGEVKS